MATLHTHHPGPTDPTGPRRWNVAPVPQSLHIPAIARLLAPRPTDDELRQAAVDFQHNLLAEGFDASRLWATFQPAPDGTTLLGQACMVVPSSGRTAGVYCSFEHPHTTTPSHILGYPLSDAQTAERFDQRVALLRESLHWLRTSAKKIGIDIHLAQALIEPSQEDLADAFVAAGFSRLAELAYLRRDIPRFGRMAPPTFPKGVTLVRVADLGWEAAQEPLLAAMQRSYIHTHDCPALCAIRQAKDVLASHKAVGLFDPSLWTIVMHQHKPEGCLLLNPFAQQETVELVYIGLGPLLRGQGIASALLQHALCTLQTLGTRRLACAVDLANTPALKLYKNTKFRQFAKRLGLIADVRQAAH